MFGFSRRHPKKRSAPATAPRIGLRFDTLEDRSVPAIYSVNSLADTVNHSDSLLTLREAVEAVAATDLSALSAGELNQVFGTHNDNDTIQFELSGTVSLTLGELLLSKDVTITGTGTTALTIERNSGAASNFRIFNVGPSANVTIEKLTIAKGNLSDDAGAGLVNLGVLTLRYVTMSQNTATGASVGGAIYNVATLNASYSNFTGNSATVGGAIGVENNLAVTTISNSTFSANSASDDGGAISNAGTMTVVNSTFGSNTATNDGGAISNSGTGTMSIVYSTIALNRTTSAGGLGGGISSVASSVTLINSIVAGNTRTPSNTASDLSGNLAAGSVNNVIGDAGSAGGLTQGNAGNQLGFLVGAIINTTTGLVNFGGLTNTFALVQNSPALGAGSSSAADAAVGSSILTDQRDAARDVATPDVGAYESHHPLSPVGAPSTYERTFQPTPNADANTAFVKGLYQSTLLRGPDPAGLQGWLNALASGASRFDVAVGFYNSTENRTAQVTSYYRYFLGREPDAAGLQGWVFQLQAGINNEAQVMTNFVLSPEFTGNNDNPSFVNLMYYALLSRQADPAGFNGWVNALNSGALSRADVVGGFLNSSESLGRIVSSYFIAYLKRTADQATINAFAGALGGGTSFQSVVASLLGSDEFYSYAQQFTSPG